MLTLFNQFDEDFPISEHKCCKFIWYLW